MSLGTRVSSSVNNPRWHTKNSEVSNHRDGK
jgi:hypothetical protein